jgi:phenylalanyl-tRNA synthetase alpha chain
MASWNFNELDFTLEKDIQSAQDVSVLENLRIKYLGRKGIVAQIYDSLAQASPQDKPIVGKGANELRKKAVELIELKRQALGKKDISTKSQESTLDLTLPGVAPEFGRRHILSQTINDICGIFERLGFAVFEGPEIETEFNNFTALNIPLDHPSRDAFDTFYLKEKDPQNPSRHLLLRSHTSPAQIRVMQEHKPPLAVIVPGKVYRPDAMDASHSYMFHQIEGLVVDEDIKFSDLKGFLTNFCKKFFGSDIKMRFRPHFFPFTEPSAEVDISCYICGGKGCSVCGRKGWLEILGCGMVHPKVFEAVKYPKNKYTGLAFGMGVERIAMLKHGINDIRLFYENDVRFLKQFK